MKLKSVKSDHQKGQIRQYAGIGFLVQVRADSRSENPDPIHNNRSNHNPKINTGRKLNNMVEKNLGYASGYVSRKQGATCWGLLDALAVAWAEMRQGLLVG